MTFNIKLIRKAFFFAVTCKIFFLALLFPGDLSSSKCQSPDFVPDENCLRDTVTRIIRIPAPFGNLKSAKTNGNKLFKVDYINFTEEQKKAFEYATSIWDTFIHSEIPIHVITEFAPLSDDEVLGCCSDIMVPIKIGDRELMDYSLPLAEKLFGREINDPDEPDIKISFNNNMDWYFGIDGETPGNKSDFVTIALHEICHGLGFTGTLTALASRGTWGSEKKAYSIFDKYIINEDGYLLVDTTMYPRLSKDLYTQLTSPMFFKKDPFFSSNFKVVPLYAPGKFNGGSSIYHLSISDNLMNYSTSDGTSIHDPAGLVVEILNQLGWQTPTISHTPTPQFVDQGNIVITASVKPAFETKLFFSFWEEKWDSIEMVQSGDSMKATLNTKNNQNMKYYFRVEDHSHRQYYCPDRSGCWYFQTQVGTGIENVASNQVKIYPNPANMFLNIQTNNNQKINSEIKVFDIFGKEMYTKTINSANEVINTSDFLEGIYFIRFQKENNSLVRKFLVQH